MDKHGNIAANHYTITISLYARHYYWKWAQYFNKTQIHIVNGDVLVKNPVVELQKVEQFLQLDNYYTQDSIYFNETKGFYCIKGRHCVGNTRDNVYKELADGENIDVEKLKIKLAEYFKPHNYDFYRMTGVQL